jgi:hypothetical protein
MELGIKAYLHGDYKSAIASLRAALVRARANPGAVVADDRTNAAMSRAMVALALSHARDGAQDLAVEVMSEYIRSAREPVTRRVFGPPGEQLYDQVRKQLEPTKRGKLVVNVSEPDAQISLNEQGVGRGAAYSGDLLPGAYRVIVRVGQQARRYDMSVTSESTTTLDVDWSLDSTLHVSDEWVGLTGTNGRSELHYAQLLARRLDFTHRVLLLGTRLDRGRLTVFGSQYADGKASRIARSGEVQVADVTKVESVRRLVRFLRGNGRGEGVIVRIDDAPRPRGPVERRMWPAYAAGVVAVGALAAGGALFYYDDKCKGGGPLADCKQLNECTAGAIATTSAGALAAIGATAALPGGDGADDKRTGPARPGGITREHEPQWLGHGEHPLAVRRQN